MDYSTLFQLSITPISTQRAEKYSSESGFEVDLVIGSHNQDAGYWTNNHFEVLQDFSYWKKGDTVVLNYLSTGELFGHYHGEKYGGDVGILMEDGRKQYFISPEKVELTIRNGEFIPKTGTCIVTQVKKEKPKSIILSIQEQDEYFDNVFDVCFVGEPTPIKDLQLTNTNRASVYPLTEAIPSVGDRIVTMYSAGFPLESLLNKKFDKQYWTIEMNGILGKYEDMQPYGDRVLVKLNAESSNQTESGLFLLKRKAESVKRAKVVSCGESSVVKAGDEVVIGKGGSYERDGLMIVKQDDILLIAQEEEV